MWICQANWSPLRDGMDLVNYKATCLAQQDKVYGVLLYLFMHGQLCVYDGMMQGITWQRNCHEILKKALVDISLRAIGSN